MLVMVTGSVTLTVLKFQPRKSIDLYKKIYRAEYHSLLERGMGYRLSRKTTFVTPLKYKTNILKGTPENLQLKLSHIRIFNKGNCK